MMIQAAKAACLKNHRKNKTGSWPPNFRFVNLSQIAAAITAF
jgi:hypothetical protein